MTKEDQKPRGTSGVLFATSDQRRLVNQEHLNWGFIAYALLNSVHPLPPPQIHNYSEPQNVTLFRNRVFADEIS